MVHDPTKNVHFISSPAHRKALDQLEATLITAENWLRPALQHVSCTDEWQAFLLQLRAAKRFLLTGATR